MRNRFVAFLLVLGISLLCGLFSYDIDTAVAVEPPLVMYDSFDEEVLKAISKTEFESSREQVGLTQTIYSQEIFSSVKSAIKISAIGEVTVPVKSFYQVVKENNSDQPSTLEITSKKDILTWRTNFYDGMIFQLNAGEYNISVLEESGRPVSHTLTLVEFPYSGSFALDKSEFNTPMETKIRYVNEGGTLIVYTDEELNKFLGIKTYDLDRETATLVQLPAEIVESDGTIEVFSFNHLISSGYKPLIGLRDVNGEATDYSIGAFVPYGDGAFIVVTPSVFRATETQLLATLYAIGDRTHPIPIYWAFFQKIEGLLDIWLILSLLFAGVLGWFVYINPKRGASMTRRFLNYLDRSLNLPRKIKYFIPGLLFITVLLVLMIGASWLLFINNLAPSWLARIIISSDSALASLGVSRVFNVITFILAILLGIVVALEVIFQKDLVIRRYSVDLLNLGKRYLTRLSQKISFNGVLLFTAVIVIFVYLGITTVRYLGIEEYGTTVTLSLKSINKINPTSKLFKEGVLSQSSLLADRLETSLSIPFSRKTSQLTVKSDLKSQSDIYAEWKYKDESYGQLVYSPNLEGYKHQKIGESRLSIYSKDLDFSATASDTSGLIPELIGNDNTRVGFSRYALSNNSIAGVEDVNYQGISWKDFYMPEESLSAELLHEDLTREYDFGDIKGDFEIYVYLEDNLDASLSYGDLNKDFGTDSFYMVLLDRNSNVVFSKKIDDDNLPIRSGESVNHVDFSTDLIAPGLYRILLTSDLQGSLFANKTIEEFNTDLVFKSLTINSNYLIYRPISKFWTLPENFTNQFFDIRDRKVQIEEYETDLFSLKEECHIEAINKFSQGEKIILNSESNCFSGKMAKSFFTIYSPTESSYFYPFSVDINEMSSADEVVIVSDTIELHDIRRGEELVLKIFTSDQSRFILFGELDLGI